MSMIYAVVPSAGAGTRMAQVSGGRRKQHLELAGRSILMHTLDRLRSIAEIDHIVCVLPEMDIREHTESNPDPGRITYAAGGFTRFESVLLGLRRLSRLRPHRPGDLVAIHDGVRPILTPELFRALVAAARECGAAVPYLPLVDTIKAVFPPRGEAPIFAGHADRAAYVAVQTPQVFDRERIERAYERAAAEGRSDRVTDDCSLLAPDEICLVPGDSRNIKITEPGDLAIARLYLG